MSDINNYQSMNNLELLNQELDRLHRAFRDLKPEDPRYNWYQDKLEYLYVRLDLIFNPPIFIPSGSGIRPEDMKVGKWW